MSWTLSLAPEVTVLDGELGDILIGVRRRVVLRIPSAGPGVHAAIRCLAAADADKLSLRRTVMATDGVHGLVQLEACLFELGARQLLGYRLSADGRTLFTALPLVTDTVFNPASPVPSERVVLSRFACMRRQDGHLVLETPMSAVRVVLGDARAMGLLAAFAAPTLVAEVGALADVPAGLVREAAAGAVGVRNARGGECRRCRSGGR